MKNFTLTKNGRPIKNFTDEEVAEIYLTSLNDREQFEYKIYTVETVELENPYSVFENGTVKIKGDCGTVIPFAEVNIKTSFDKFEQEQFEYIHCSIDKIEVNGVELSETRFSDYLKNSIETDADDLAEERKLNMISL